jgi:hypothetical protein
MQWIEAIELVSGKPILQLYDMKPYFGKCHSGKKPPFLGHDVQCKIQDRRNGALCVEMGFYADISWESRRNIEINVWAHFYKILLVFEVPYWPQVKWMPEKS